MGKAYHQNDQDKDLTRTSASSVNKSEKSNEGENNDLSGEQTTRAKPMGGVGGRVESKAGETDSDQQKIGGTTVDNQGDNPALR